jgi:hypothetical protein
MHSTQNSGLQCFYFHNLNFPHHIFFSGHTTEKKERNVGSDLPVCVKSLEILKYIYHQDLGNISKYVDHYLFKDFPNELESTEHVQICLRC